MTTSSYTPVLHPTRIDLPPEIRQYVVQMLNQNLACVVDLRSQVKQACWNVKGQDFSPLRALFTTIAIELGAYSDLLAERISVLGGVVMGTARTVAIQSSVSEYPNGIVEGNAHVLALAERVAHYATAVRDGIARATDVEDTDTAAICTDISRGVDKQLWILEAHLHRPAAIAEPKS